MPVVEVPSALRAMTGGASRVTVVGSTVAQAIEALSAQHPGLREKLWQRDGKLKRAIGIFIGDDDVRSTDALEWPVTEADVITLVVAISGG